MARGNDWQKKSFSVGGPLNILEKACMKCGNNKYEHPESVLECEECTEMKNYKEAKSA